jgi:hypothetical protein
VQCTSDAGCALAAPICSDGACVQCRKDKDCPTTAPTCRRGKCQP